MNDRAPLGRVALGATVLAGERLRLFDKPVPDSLAVLVGVAGRGRDTARRLLRRTNERVRDMAPQPPQRVRQFLDDTRARGERTIRVGRLEAQGWFKTTMDESIRWAERTVIPRVVDDMTPYLVKTVVPKILDGAMPQIRSRVVPVIVEDLSTDERIRTLIAEQSHSILAEATDELRDTSARADDRLEGSFRRMFRA
jgi:hypothetical protein